MLIHDTTHRMHRIAILPSYLTSTSSNSIDFVRFSYFTVFSYCRGKYHLNASYPIKT